MTDPSMPQPEIVSYIFIDVTDVDGARRFFEEALRFPVASDILTPPHHIHGLVKYDAGSTLFSLNKARPTFDRTASDHIVLDLACARDDWWQLAARNPWIRSVSGTTVTSADNHVFRVEPGPPSVCAIQYRVADLSATRSFYETALALEFTPVPEGLSAQTDTMRLCFCHDRTDPTDRSARRSGLILTVLHAEDIHDRVAVLSRQGVSFLSNVQESAIGRTVRFTDPDGHHFCLYEPSQGSLDERSGPVLRRLIKHAALSRQHRNKFGGKRHLRGAS